MSLPAPPPLPRALRTLAISAGPDADAADLAWLAALERHGVEALQIREKSRSDREILHLARSARASAFSGRILINGRVDLALAADVHGAHLPAAEIPTRDLREHFGPELLLGRSTHSLEEVELEAASGANFVTFGPIYATPSKAQYGPPLGLSALRQAVRVGLPVLALGGIDRDRLEEIADTGAHGIAAIRLFADRGHLSETMTRIRSAFGDRP